MMPSPVNLSRSPRSARRLHDLRPPFRVELLCKLHRALHVGEHHGDLLRSPSRADLDCRIFSARCRGVYSRGARKGGVRSATFALHSRDRQPASRLRYEPRSVIRMVSCRTSTDDARLRGLEPAAWIAIESRPALA